MRFAAFFSVLFLFNISFTQTNAGAQQSTTADTIKVYASPEVVITANRVETQYDEVASTMTVLRADELALRQVRTVSQALQSVASLAFASTGGIGKATSVFLRGANSDHTLVLLDGVELNDPGAPGNAFDFGAMMVNDIQKIEVLHGAQSTLFGSNAIGGVINILTRPPSGNLRFFAEAEAGGYATTRFHTGLQGGNDKLHYRVSGNRLQTGGFSASGLPQAGAEKDSYENKTLAAKLHATAGNTAQFELQMQYVDASGDIDHGGATGDDPNYTFEVMQLTAAAVARFSHLQNRWQHSLRMTFTDHDRDAIDLTDAQRTNDASRSQTFGRRLKYDWQNNLFFSGRWIAVFGVESERETASSSFHSESSFGTFDSDFAERAARTTGVFLQNHIKPNRALSVNLGFRVDHHSAFGSKATYRSGVAYQFSTSTRLKATIGTGFNAPTLFEVYDPAFGNSELQPEESLTGDIGIEQQFFAQKVQFGATWFASIFDKMIGFDENFRSINIDQATARGMEVALTANPFKLLSLRATYAFVRTEDKSPQSPDFGMALLRRPEHRAALNMHLRPNKRTGLHVGLLYSDIRVDKDFDSFPASRVALDAYFLANIAATYHVSSTISVNARIDNLFDSDYQEVLHFNTAGRTAYLGLQSTF